MPGHGDLFGQRVVRDALAYVRLAWNPNDRPALVRALEAPPRGLGRLAAVLAEEPIALGELPRFAQDFGPSAVAGAADLVATVYELMPKLRAARALSTSRIERWSEAAIEPGSSDGLTQRPG